MRCLVLLLRKWAFGSAGKIAVLAAFLIPAFVGRR